MSEEERTFEIISAILHVYARCAVQQLIEKIHDKNDEIMKEIEKRDYLVPAVLHDNHDVFMEVYLEHANAIIEGKVDVKTGYAQLVRALHELFDDLVQNYIVALCEEIATTAQ